MIVKEIDLFKDLHYEIMSEIADICLEENCAKGTVLFEKDEAAERLYILVDGTVELIIKNGGTITYRLTEYGDIFGWSSMVENGRYTASCVCATDLRAVKIERKKLDMLFNRHPDVGIKILRRLAGVFSQRLITVYQDLLSVGRPETHLSFN